MSQLDSLKRLKKRHAKERRFHFYGRATIAFVLILLAVMFVGLLWKSSSAFHKTFIKVEITFPNEERINFREQIYQGILSSYSWQTLDRHEILPLISPAAELELIQAVKEQPLLRGQSKFFWLLASDEVDYLLKNTDIRQLDSASRRLSGTQINFIDDLERYGNIQQQFNWAFFTNGDSRSPELAGIYSALVGSIYTILVTLILAFPLGIAAAIYLEEFAERNRFVRFVELNINNLASVPSIVFGLLGLAVFLNVMHLPRSSAVVGGMTLAIMTMPIIVIAARSAMQMVPRSIRQAAEGLGASPVQVVFHHVVPLAIPGILTGTILGVSRALGESAALLMIGMVAFIVEAPETPLDPTSVLPVQIFNWARNPERGFVDHTAAAIVVLLVLLLVMNFGAILLRKRTEHRW